MIARWQEKEVISSLRARRVVNLTGVRQCGKTTLADALVIPKARRFTLDDEQTRIAAASDPYGFVERREGETIVIDEIQKVPALLNAIKMRVDKDNARGQYLLTGSSNLHFAKAVSDSLAGRVGRIRLRTLSFGELQGGNGDFLERAFRRDFPQEISGFDKRRIISLAVRSGYPEALEMDARTRRRWFLSYLDDILEKDVRDVTEIRKVEALRKVAEWLLLHSSKFFEVAELSAKTGISKETAQNYIAALKALYIVDEVPAWTRSDYSKIGKRNKFFASDAGLIANILGWTEDSIYMSEDRSGKMVESWVYQNIASSVYAGVDYEITQYRDSNKREVDFVVERSDGAILGIEVKAGSSFGAEDFRHLKWFAANMAKGDFTGVILYSGSHTLCFGDGFYAVPLASLGA